MPAIQTAATYTVHVPEWPSRHNLACGWIVKMPGGHVAYSGDERGARAYARAMNRRVARGDA